MKDSYDVVVIGAGPAGTTTGKFAAQGAKVLIVDKHSEIGVPKRCGEGLGKRTFREFNLSTKEKFVNRDIYGFAVYPPNGKVVRIRYDDASGYVIERKIFDKFLATEAARNGAEVYADTLASLWKEDGKIRGVSLERFGEEFKVEAKIIVAADGVDSAIARDGGINTTLALQDLDSCLEYEMCNLKLGEADLIHLYMGNEIAPRGYCWVFPKDKDRANVGIGISGAEEKTAKFYLDKFINSQEGLKKGGILEVNVGSVPVGGFLKNLVKDNLLIVGDAARQVNPVHGGGIYEVMCAGKLAGEKMAKAISEDNLSLLKEYEREWNDSHGKKLKNVLRIRNFAEKLSDEDMNYLASVWNGEDLTELSRGKYSEVFKKAIQHPKLFKLVKNFL